MEDENRVGQRDLRLPGDLPQPATASFRARDAHSDRVRTATPIRPTRGLKPGIATPPNPGHIRVSGHAGAVQVALSVGIRRINNLDQPEFYLDNVQKPGC